MLLFMKPILLRVGCQASPGRSSRGACVPEFSSSAHAGPARRGFTLVEMAFVLIIIGFITVAAIASWSTLTAGRRIATTQGVLNNVKQCLIKRIIYSNQYPTYTANLDCSTVQPDLSQDVDSCLCKDGVDGYGQLVYFIEGLDEDNTTGLEGLYVEEDLAKGLTGALHGEPGAQSTVINQEGLRVDDVAFVLVSYGADRQANDQSYDVIATPGSEGDRVATMRTAADITNPVEPDFTVSLPNPGPNDEDDQVVIVTRREIIQAIRE